MDPNNPNDIIKALNRSLALLRDLSEVPSTHLTLTQMEVTDFKQRIAVSSKEITDVRETLKSDLDWDG